MAKADHQVLIFCHWTKKKNQKKQTKNVYLRVTDG